MKLKELYSKPINRAVNPAVSATKFDPETERIEIQEYVFTDEDTNELIGKYVDYPSEVVFNHFAPQIEVTLQK